eukprot:5075032-Prymnesium_polylepis.2
MEGESHDWCDFVTWPTQMQGNDAQADDCNWPLSPLEAIRDACNGAFDATLPDLEPEFQQETRYNTGSAASHDTNTAAESDDDDRVIFAALEDSFGPRESSRSHRRSRFP